MKRSMVWGLILTGLLIHLTGCGKKTELDEKVLENIQVYMTLGEYDQLIEYAKKENILESEELLNIQGIMYANGLGIDRDMETAMKYFKAAAARGSDVNSYRNLLLASVVADINNLEKDSSAGMQNTLEAFAICQKNDVTEMENMIADLARMSGEEPGGEKAGYEFLESCENKNDLLRAGFAYIGDDLYYVTDNYSYIVSGEGDELAAEAEAAHVIQYKRPLYIMRAYPSQYVSFYDEGFFDAVVGDAVKIDEFDVPSCYVNEGNQTVKVWDETDETVTGDTKPKDSDNVMWVYWGLNDNGEKIYKKRIKIRSV